MNDWGRHREVEKSKKDQDSLWTWRDTGDSDCVLQLRQDGGDYQVWIGLLEPEAFIVGIGPTPDAARDNAVVSLERFAAAAKVLR